MEAFNTSIFLSINSLANQSAFFDAVIVFFADYLAYILGAVFLGLLFYKNISRLEKLKLFTAVVFGAIIGRGVIVETVRYFYRHPRQSVVLEGVVPILSKDSFSFPSGHATF